jgi:hypothetical protein
MTVGGGGTIGFASTKGFHFCYLYQITSFIAVRECLVIVGSTVANLPIVDSKRSDPWFV